MHYREKIWHSGKLLKFVGLMIIQIGFLFPSESYGVKSIKPSLSCDKLGKSALTLCSTTGIGCNHCFANSPAKKSYGCPIEDISVAVAECEGWNTVLKNNPNFERKFCRRLNKADIAYLCGEPRDAKAVRLCGKSCPTLDSSSDGDNTDIANTTEDDTENDQQ